MEYKSNILENLTPDFIQLSPSIKVDVINDRVAVGPIQGATFISRFIVKSTGDSDNQIVLQHSGNGVPIVGIGQESSHGSLQLRLNSGSTQVRLSAINNNYIMPSLGVGTASPNAKLDVEDGHIRNTNDSSGDFLDIFCDGDGTGSSIISSSNNDIVIRPSIGELGIKANAFGNTGGHGLLKIYNGANAVQVQLNSSGDSYLTGGNVGIGMTTPNADLQIESTNNGMTNGLNTNQLKLSYGASNDGDGSSLAFGVSADDKMTGAKIVHERTGTNSVGDLSFWTRSSAGSGTDYDLTVERMRINSAGAIKFNDYGAGTLVTDASGNITASSGGGAGGPYLPLAGGTMTGATLHGDNVLSRYGTGNDFSIYHSGTDGYLQNETGNLIIPNGNVSIGKTTTALGKLDVSGTLAMSVGTTKRFQTFYSGNFTFINGGASGGTIYFGAPATYTQNFRVQGTGIFNSTVTATNFILSSDKILKENIKDIDHKHIDVNWKNFELKTELGVKRSGVIAQELEKNHPEFVRTDEEGLKSVAYIDLLIAKIAELEHRIKQLEK